MPFSVKPSSVKSSSFSSRTLLVDPPAVSTAAGEEAPASAAPETAPASSSPSMRDRVDLRHRAVDLVEWMDGPCDYETLRDCLRSIAESNRWTRAYPPVLQFLDRLAARCPGAPLHIVDVGSGYGDMLREVRRWALRNNVIVTLTGVDLNPNAGRAAYEADAAAGVPPGEIRWVTGDAIRAAAPPVDVVLSSQTMHHLQPREIVRLLDWMERLARRGWFISDLERRVVPYYGYQLLSRVLRFHPYVQHDGPVSIRRSFRPEDWTALLAEAGLPSYAARLIHSFPGRLCVERIR